LRTNSRTQMIKASAIALLVRHELDYRSDLARR